MKVSTNVEESLPIELLQKGFQITEDEVCLIVSTQKIGDYERK